MFSLNKVKKFFLDNIFYLKDQFNYLNHLKKNFHLKNYNTNKIILVEFYPSWTSLIANFYLIYSLKLKHRSNAVLYIPKIPSKLKYYYYIISSFLKVGHFRIFHSFCQRKILFPKFNRKIKRKYLLRINRIKSKSEILNLKFKNIIVGDLLYDSFLKNNNKYTLDIKSDEFKKYTLEFISLFEYWFEFFKNNKVVSIVASHPVYENALPLRIANNFKVLDTYTSSIHFTYKHSIKNKSINYDVKKKFKLLKKKEQSQGLIIAEKLLKKKFKGNNTIDAVFGDRSPITQKISFKKNNLKNCYKEKNNILIMAHSFSDAPHVFGKFVFSDHYEWLKYLAKKSVKNKKFNWLVKIHPIFYDKEISFMKEIFKEYPNVQILSKSTTNEYLISKGIKFVLSVYGSAVYEYGFFGIPSILASKNHPYKFYNFYKDAKNLKEYNYLIENLENLKFNYDRKEIFEYYYSRFCKMNKLFKNYPSLVSKLNDNFNTAIIYRHWLKELSVKKNQRLMNAYKEYINSNKYSFEFF